MLDRIASDENFGTRLIYRMLFPIRIIVARVAFYFSFYFLSGFISLKALPYFRGLGTDLFDFCQSLS